MSPMMDMMGVWMWLWGAVAVAVIVLIVVAVVRLAGRGSVSRELPGSAAEEELRRRYAAGELDHDEFLERQAILRREEE